MKLVVGVGLHLIHNISNGFYDATNSFVPRDQNVWWGRKKLSQLSSLYLLLGFLSNNDETLCIGNARARDVHNTFEIFVSAPGVGLEGWGRISQKLQNLLTE